MKRHHRDALAVIAGMLEPRGLVCTFQHGRTHAAVVVTTRCGQLRAKFPISGSPRDPDAQLNQVRQQVAHWMDECGMGSRRGRAGQRAERRPPPARVASTATPPQRVERCEGGPMRDPWAVLANLQPQR